MKKSLLALILCALLPAVAWADGGIDHPNAPCDPNVQECSSSMTTPTGSVENAKTPSVIENVIIVLTPILTLP